MVRISKPLLYTGIGILLIFLVVFLAKSGKQTPLPSGNANPIEESLLSQPDSPQKYIDLANHYRSQNLYDEAERASQKAIELDPENPTAYLQLGNLYRYTKRFSEAEDVIREAMALAPNDDWPFVQLGNLYRDMGRTEEAEAMFRKAIEVNPKRGWGYKELGRLYRESGDAKRAEEMFLASITADPNQSEPDNAYADLATLYESQGRMDEADAIRRKAQEVTQSPTP